MLGVLTSVLSVSYYVRLPVVMYMRESGEEMRGEIDTFAGIALAGCALGVLWLGLLPNHGSIRVLDVLRSAAAGLVP